MGRMRLNDTGHLSAVTGLSCRGRLPAVCPVLTRHRLGSWRQVAREAEMRWKPAQSPYQKQLKGQEPHQEKQTWQEKGREQREKEDLRKILESSICSDIISKELGSTI